MNYIVPVFLGSKDKDLVFARTIFEGLDSFGIAYKMEIVSGEKASEDCIGRVKGYDKLAEKDERIAQRPIYSVNVGKRNVMGPLISGLTHNSVITTPIGSVQSIEMNMWSSLDGPSDSPLITVFGDGKASAIYLAEIIGTDVEEIRKGVCDRKRISYTNPTATPFFYVINKGDRQAVEKITKTMQRFEEFHFYPTIVDVSEAKNTLKKSSAKGPIILVSELCDDDVVRFAEITDSPLIVTPSYDTKDITKLRGDAEGFLRRSMNNTLPVGVVLSPDNATLAALRIESLRYDDLSERLKTDSEKLRGSYKNLMER
jgi:phosphoribosylcarboxyaminoimidazole (NCAIR) mutase